MVDLDKGRLRYNEKDIQHLPDEHFDAMVNALAKCVSNMSGKDADWAPVRLEKTEKGRGRCERAGRGRMAKMFEHELL